MPLSNKEIKKRYFERVYEDAKWIECACGCGEKLKNKDQYGRDKKFINGHNGRKYDDPKQYKREWNHRNRAYNQRNKKKYGYQKKQKLIILKGSKCSKCSLMYNGKNASLFDLHHRDPEQKSFALNMGTLIDKAWQKILVEAEKCDLICSNCHRLKHSGEY
jgi:hypothetical protein